ncbi:MAG: NAD(P)-binding domain-containing protein [Akkermansiaceae bacterium]|jgi:NosR/NirI family transcriptional regulator, nitrous oxide reductase regulator|nr:NAD(P)-binding domain-containing protein [Akkermansiaceae bacterium]MDP4781159.1 NAD(P)-binding domain-containing protein [Akkermansiaceae bacterium]
MFKIIKDYTHWLHGKWPAGGVEKAPAANDDGTCNVPGIFIVGDLTGVPLLKFSADTGARAVQTILEDKSFEPGDDGGETLDLAIIGAGVSGISAAIEASKSGLNYKIYESAEAFSTIRNFPRKKPIYAYPTDMVPTGEMRFESDIKEDLLVELEEQRKNHGIETTELAIEKISRSGGKLNLHTKDKTVTAKRVIIAIGRTGNFRKLNVPGEGLEKVSNRLIDASKFGGKKVLVVGGGDSAMEAAISLAEEGAQVDLSYRKKEFSRPKAENIEKLKKLEADGTLTLHLGTNIQDIDEEVVTICGESGCDTVIPNDFVFTLIGREAPLDFFRKSGITVSGDKGAKFWATISFALLFCVWMYHWKKGGKLPFDGHLPEWLLPNPGTLFAGLAGWWSTPGTLGYIFKGATNDPSFYYSLAYCSCVLIFGIRRIRRRKTPYVKLQTTVLTLIQWIPLFILPYFVFPWLGANSAFTSGGFGQWFGETFLSNGPGTAPDQYWRSFGFILAWPLFVFNLFTEAPMWGWLILGFIQTFVIIPLIVWRWGKGAYCGWICSCGALAETMGDAHRHKMPHGPFWNKLNMVGQVVLAFAFVILAIRIFGWVFPSTGANELFNTLLYTLPVGNYSYLVDLWLAGILGVAFYFHFSGRVWCRFACPLAALMHIYARFTRFRIFADKDKCISCNVCTTVCHQGIDVMAFANKGKPMEDPECVRCSACVQSCPTGVLNFGRIGKQTAEGYKPIFDTLPASLVQLAEQRKAKSKT